MKYVLDSSVAAKWYLPNPDTVKALKFRFDFHAGIHEVLAPDILMTECAGVLVKAERAGDIDPEESVLSLNDLLVVGITIFLSSTLIRRATEIALSTRLTVCGGLYVALAEREQCQLLSADQKALRIARKHFPFVVPFASFP
ncbi:type II toxin-antitoxin system VapC family toxin [Zavarzinella formosa]|uniref:type II toxin-antitoxin system VapC family toxin n=1 Tax=Zavarzinella formosa TaxID=360055 RepID=UPI00030D8E7C|nr:type II toxin-antitoxin system VapC family toxin [Zavarzinella formosa]